MIATINAAITHATLVANMSQANPFSAGNDSQWNFFIESRKK